MNADELKKAGEALYGKRWKAPLARELGLDPTTLWRYLQKDSVPKHVAIAVRAMTAKAKTT